MSSGFVPSVPLEAATNWKLGVRSSPRRCAQPRCEVQDTTPAAQLRRTQPPARMPSGRTQRDSESFGALARDIAQYRLLGPDEERELTARVARLRVHAKARQALTDTGAPSEEAVAKDLNISVAELNEERSAGISARDALVAANLRLVVKVARDVWRRRVDRGSHGKATGASLLDLVQEGALGLLRAADAFDPERGVKFSTFAYLAVRRSCERAFATHNFAIRVPERLILASNRLRGAAAEFFAEHGKWPTDAQLAEIRPDINVPAVRLAERRMRQPLELDKPLLAPAPSGDNSTVTLGDFLADERDQGPDDALEDELAAERIRRAIRKVLKPRDARVLILRFGLDGGEPAYGKTIAEVFDISEVRVHQICRASLEKLRVRQPELAELL